MHSAPTSFQIHNVLIHKIDNLDRSISENMAQTYLDSEEYFIWKEHASRIHRQSEWLRGRIVLKELIQIIHNTPSDTIQFHDIHIKQNKSSKPFYEIDNAKNKIIAHDISLSHGSSVSIGAICLGHEMIGIDYENLSECAQGEWLKRAFHDEELALFPDCRFEQLLSYWTAKEAASKAAGTGLGGRWRQWRIASVHLHPESVVIKHASETYTVNLHCTGNELMSICIHESGNTDIPVT